MFKRIKNWWLEQAFPVQLISAMLVGVPVGSFLFTTWILLLSAYVKWLKNFI